MTENYFFGVRYQSKKTEKVTLFENMPTVYPPAKFSKPNLCPSRGGLCVFHFPNGIEQLVSKNKSIGIYTIFKKCFSVLHWYLEFVFHRIYTVKLNFNFDRFYSEESTYFS